MQLYLIFRFFVIIKTMKKKAELGATLCENFCAYFKPGKNEEIACEGFVVVQRLIERGKTIPLKKRAKSGSDPASADVLRASMCKACAFFESDCDFIMTGGKALPCGGFSLLHQLLDAGEITVEEIKRR
jgi:hypothetical protein